MGTSMSKLDFPNLAAAGMIIVFIILFVYTFLTVFSITVKSGGDKVIDLNNAMSMVVIVDFVLITFYAGIATYYVTMNPSYQQSYMMLLLHINILLSIIALSFSSFYTIT